MGFPAGTAVISANDLKRIKSDRRFLELALEEAGSLLRRRPMQISDNACCCPFHPDEHPSGSLHQDYGANRPGDWLFTCHACGNFGGTGGWNDLNPKNPTSSGDAVAVLRVAARRAGRQLDFQAACQWLLRKHAQRFGKGRAAVTPAPPPTAVTRPSPQIIARAAQEAAEAHRALMNDPGLLDRLWNERAVAKGTAQRFGVAALRDRFGREWWIFPIMHADGTFMAQKRHAADGGRPKAQWDPPNAKSGEPLYPVDVSGTGPVWVCPGEFKALAVISLGLPALSGTAGEEVKGLPPRAVQLLRGRAAAIAADNDDAGRRWASAIRRQLVEAGIDARIVDLGLKADRQDIGDWIVERRVKQKLDAATVAQQLTEAFERTPVTKTSADETLHLPITADDDAQPAIDVGPLIQPIGAVWRDKRTWKPVVRVAAHIKTLDDVLHGGCVTGGVHLIGGKAGQCKTQLALQIAVNAAQHGVPVGFISLEMDKGEVGRLALAQLSEVPRTTIDNGLRTLHDKLAAQQVSKAMRTFENMPLDIFDGGDVDGGFTREHLSAVVACGVESRGWKLVMLDHLGELAPLGHDAAAQTLQIDKANAAVMRAVARRHDIALIVVAPLRKSANFKDAKTGKFHIDDIMGSAAIAYAVRTCVVVCANYRRPPQDSEVSVKFLKNRNGPLPDKTLSLRWLASCGRIIDP